MPVELGPFSLDRVVRAVERVRERLLRATAILGRAGIPYAVVGGNAVALWVSRVDEAAVRNTQDVDILIRRADLDAAKAAMEAAGFVYRHVASIDMFLDGPTAKARDAVHLIFDGERVRADDPVANPSVDESEDVGDYRVLALQALVRIKLNVFRIKDQMHLLDMIEIGLIDEGWADRYPEPLAARLRHLLDTPGG